MVGTMVTTSTLVDGNQVAFYFIIKMLNGYKVGAHWSPLKLFHTLEQNRLVTLSWNQKYRNKWSVEEKTAAQIAQKLVLWSATVIVIRDFVLHAHISLFGYFFCFLFCFIVPCLVLFWSISIIFLLCFPGHVSPERDFNLKGVPV